MTLIMDLNAVRQFLKVVECQSFTEAAVQLGVTQSGVSRAISRLEQQLGVRLLHRNTRGLSLTPDGILFYQRSGPLVGGLEELRRQLQERRCAPSGVLKLSAPSAFGRVVLMPILARLLERHPQLQVDMVMTDRMVELVDEGFDAVLRTGTIGDQRLIARPLAPLDWVTIASPDYLSRRGIPGHPRELVAHNCLRVRSQHTGRPDNWRFSESGRACEVDVDGNLVFDHGDPLLDAARQGIGIVQVMAFYAREALARGEVQAILADYTRPPHPLSLVYQPSRQHSAKLQVLKDALLQHWGAAE